MLQVPLEFLVFYGVLRTNQSIQATVFKQVTQYTLYEYKYIIQSNKYILGETR